MENPYKEVVAKINEGNKCLVVSHVNPEGDAIGSLLGLALALKGLGKDVTAYLEDVVPETFKFLPGSCDVVNDISLDESFDVTFAVDCGQRERLGSRFMKGSNFGTIVNIDHHATNDLFGDVNVINAKASATGEMIYDILKVASITVTREIATNLYVAIHTDTGSFRYSSTTSEALRKAGELVSLGVDPWEVSQHVYENHPLKRVKLLGRVLETLEVVDNGKVASIAVTLDMLNEFEADKSQADGFVNYTRGIQGVDIGILFRETGVGAYKVSFRSKGKINVSMIAQDFAGGGHANAAGCNLKGTLAEVKARVLNAAYKVIVNRDEGN